MKEFMAKKKIFGTVLFYFTFALLFIIFAIPAVILALLPSRWRYTNKLFGWGAFICYWLLVKATCLRVTLYGKEHLPTTAAIFVANHQSLLDIPLLGQLVFGKPHLWLLKEDLQKVPVFGFIVKRFGILVDRRTLATAGQALTQSLNVANGQMDIMIFPEGGRYIDDSIHSFFSGFAIIAQKTGRPVIPVFMKNLNRVYPPHSRWIYNYPVTITIGEPMKMMEGEAERAFVHRVREWFVQQMERSL